VQIVAIEIAINNQLDIRPPEDILSRKMFVIDPEVPK